LSSNRAGLTCFDLRLVVRRHELSDEQWQVIEPLLPVSGARGPPRVDDRRLINGMLFKAKTRVVAWRDLPERYGPWKTVYSRSRWLPASCALTSMPMAPGRLAPENVEFGDRSVRESSGQVKK
jgi:transposase